MRFFLVAIWGLAATSCGGTSSAPTDSGPNDTMASLDTGGGASDTGIDSPVSSGADAPTTNDVSDVPTDVSPLISDAAIHVNLQVGTCQVLRARGFDAGADGILVHDPATGLTWGPIIGEAYATDGGNFVDSIQYSAAVTFCESQGAQVPSVNQIQGLMNGSVCGFNIPAHLWTSSVPTEHADADGFRRVLTCGLKLSGLSGKPDTCGRYDVDSESATGFHGVICVR